MEKYVTIDLNIFLGLILFMIIVMIQRKQKYQVLSTRLFVWLCWSVIVLLFLDAFSWAVNGVHFWSLYLSILLFYLIEPIPLLLWLCYLNYHLYQSVKRLRRRWFYTQPLIFVALLLVVNVFTGFIFTIDENSIYHRGPGIPLILGANLLIIFYTMGFGIFYFRQLEKRVFNIIVMFALFPVVGGIVQVLTYGVSILWNSVALAVIFIYLFLETQKEMKDYLTGLLNRQQIDDIMAVRMMEYPKKGGFSLIMVDMDDFKEINDCFGHKEGDRALIHMSQVLYSSVKNIDKIARFGGDEFVILLEENEPKNIEKVISRIQQKLAGEKNIGSGRYIVSASIGYAVYSPDEHATLQSLLNQADRNMYGRKQEKSRIKYSSVNEHMHT